MYRVIAKFVTLTVHIRTLQNGLIHQSNKVTVQARRQWSVNSRFWFSLAVESAEQLVPDVGNLP